MLGEAIGADSAEMGATLLPDVLDNLSPQASPQASPQGSPQGATEGRLRQTYSEPSLKLKQLLDEMRNHPTGGRVEQDFTKNTENALINNRDVQKRARTKAQLRTLDLQDSLREAGEKSLKKNFMTRYESRMWRDSMSEAADQQNEFRTELKQKCRWTIDHKTLTFGRNQYMATVHKNEQDFKHYNFADDQRHGVATYFANKSFDERLRFLHSNDKETERKNAKTQKELDFIASKKSAAETLKATTNYYRGMNKELKELRDLRRQLNENQRQQKKENMKKPKQVEAKADDRPWTPEMASRKSTGQAFSALGDSGDPRRPGRINWAALDCM